jgi:outer membrane receptor protein involved in Fe transport
LAIECQGPAHFFLHPYRTAAFGNLVYTYGQNSSKDESMRRIPPLNGRLGLRYQAPSGLWSEAEWLFATKQDRLASGDVDDHRIPPGGPPGWNIVNLRFGHSLGWFAFNLGLQNLFDEAYRLHGSGVDEYGRSVWASAQFRF